jgi:triosephosphate isomerase
MRPLVAGNWKMNGLSTTLGELETLRERLAQDPVPAADIMVCPPATLLARASDVVAGSDIVLGAQDCHPQSVGPHTGDISAEMLADAGARAVIVGHSERRSDHGETNALVKAKAEAAHRAALTAIICIGETEQERRDGETLEIVGHQLEGSLPKGASAANTVIAYEPVWAIGTGKTATPEQAQDVHRYIRSVLAEHDASVADRVQILYGGSVKGDNASGLFGMPDIDGGLIGGASLKAADFLAIARAATEQRKR